jgi:hypothetical protein
LHQPLCRCQQNGQLSVQPTWLEMRGAARRGPRETHSTRCGRSLRDFRPAAATAISRAVDRNLFGGHADLATVNLFSSSARSS